MVIKVYIAGVGCSSAQKNTQAAIMRYLDSKKIPYEAIDITTPENEEQKKFMRANSKTSPGKTVPLPPQIFNDDEYLGDYDEFFNYQEDNNLDVFFKLASPTEVSNATVEVTGGQKPVEDEPVPQED